MIKTEMVLIGDILGLSLYVALLVGPPSMPEQFTTIELYSIVKMHRVKGYECAHGGRA